MLQVIAPQHRDLPVFFLLRSSWLEGSGRLSLGTRCITVVFPAGRPRAERVTFPCRNRPWYINLRISALDTWKWRVHWRLLDPVSHSSPPRPPTQAASCQTQTERCLQHSHSDWTNTPWSSRSPESIVNLSKLSVNQPATSGYYLYLLCPVEHFWSQEQASCKFILSRLVLSINVLFLHANSSQYWLQFYLLVEAAAVTKVRTLRHGCVAILQQRESVFSHVLLLTGWARPGHPTLSVCHTTQSNCEDLKLN